MKKTNKMSRTVGTLEKMYNSINTDKFDGALPIPVITVQSKPGTWGHSSTAKVWKREDENTYELNIAAEVLTGPIEEIIDTMIHEMIHLYCRENGIKEVSRGGSYHNRRFKELAEEKGLVCIRTEKYGWNTIGAGNDSLIEYALQKGWSEFEIGRETVGRFVSIAGSGTAHGGAQTVGEARPSSTRKYQCPVCKSSVRATKAVNIICGDCMVQMQQV